MNWNKNWSLFKIITTVSNLTSALVAHMNTTLQSQASKSIGKSPWETRMVLIISTKKEDISSAMYIEQACTNI